MTNDTFQPTEVAGGPTLPQERRVVTALPGPRSQELAARRAATVARGVSTTLPVFIARAGGGVLVDVDGNSLIDFGAGIAVVGVGNAAPAVVDNVREQVAKFTHTCFMVTPYEGYVAVCEELARLTPGSHDKRSALFNSGAEAVENAVKVARAYTGRQAVVAFDHGYHGRTNLTMALTAKNMPYKHSFGPFAPEVYRMPMAYPYRWPTGPERCGEEAATEVISAMDNQIGGGNIAAVVIEPIQGEGGFIVPGAGFLPQLAEYCRANGIVFVADEVQTGFACTGAWFACEYEDVVGDVRGRGAMVAVELVRPGTTTPDPESTAAVAKACHAEGLVVLTCGTYGNVLRFLPPLVMPEHLLEEGLTILEKSFTEIGGAMPRSQHGLTVEDHETWA